MTLILRSVRTTLLGGLFFLMPLAMLGNLIAVRIDGAFLNDYWGPFALFVYILAAGTAVTFERRGASAG